MEHERQWKFRLARLSGARESLRRIDSSGVQNFTDLQIDHARRMGVPVVVSLLGGIGDHLEVISMLLEWSQIECASTDPSGHPTAPTRFSPPSRIHP